jgi:LmbE family N-acetylglucosaminyl deacetylase
MTIAALLLLLLVGSCRSSSASLPSQLAQLGSLLRDGTLTPAEFASAKQTLLRAAAAAAAAADAATAPGVSSAPIPLPLNTSSWAAAGKRVMLITAHPDDAEYFAGGLVASFAAAGGNVSYLILTNGDGGGQCYDTPDLRTLGGRCGSEELALIRRREMEDAARVLNVSAVWRGDLEDGMTISYHESLLREKITAHVRLFQPHIVVTHWPEPNWRAPPTCNGQCRGVGSWDDLGYHPDHKHVGLMVYNALYSGGSSVSNGKLFKELSAIGNAPWHIEQLYMFALTKDQPITHYLSLDDVLIQRKARALASHRSQYPTPPLEAVRWTAAKVGAEIGVPLAEGYLGWF